MIIIKAIRGFPVRSQTEQLCKRVISDLTPHICAVDTDSAQDNMDSILRYLLIANCDRDDERFRFEQDIKKSDEWLNLASACLTDPKTAEEPEQTQQAEKAILVGASGGGGIATPPLGSKQLSRERGPDFKTMRERVEFEDKLREDLGAILPLTKRYTTVTTLKERFPNSELWKLLPDQEQRELLTVPFKPRAYARTLTCRKYSISKWAIEKYRPALRKQQS